MAFALYAWHLHLLPQNCVCGQKIKVEHALSCKKGVFITIRHNQVSETTANLIKMICKDLKIKPPLLPLSGKSLSERTANIQDTAGRNVFFDVRFFNASAKRYRKQNLEINEREKKKHCNERIQNVVQGSFTPLVMSANGGFKLLSEIGT